MRRTLLADAAGVHGVPAHAIRAKLEAALRRRGAGPIEDSAEVLVARVDHGRWLDDCPHCEAGIALTPDVAEAFCFGCGRRFTAITWPAELEEIERTLRARMKPSTRNWRTGETLEDLKAENRDHRVPERHETMADRAPVKGKR